MYTDSYAFNLNSMPSSQILTMFIPFQVFMLFIEYHHPTEADLEKITDVLNRSRRELSFHTDQTAEKVSTQTFEDADYDPQGYWLAIQNGQTMGYGGAIVRRSRIEAGMNDGRIDVDVVPEYRGKGIEQELMKLSLEYLKSHKIGKAQRWCMGTEGWRHDLVLQFGFKAVHHEYFMVWEGETPERYPLPERTHFDNKLIKEATDEEIVHFVEMFNNTFSEHYNFAPQSVERFIRFRDTNKDIWRITFAKDGQTTVGICSYGEYTQYNKENNTRIGIVGVLGVVKAYRRKGIGRALLSDCMTWLCGRGMDTIYLQVDAENPEALHLYTSLGFKVQKESTIYQLELE